MGFREFSKERDKAEKTGVFRAEREEKMINDAVKDYLDWIMHAELMEDDATDDDPDVDDRPRLKRKPTLRDRNNPGSSSKDDGEEKQTWYQRDSFKKIRRIIRK